MAKLNPLALIFDEVMWAHDPGPEHPESPERARWIMSALGHPEPTKRPRAATPEDLARVHTAAHIERVLAAKGQHVALDPDTRTSPQSVDAALLAAGSGCEAVDLLMSGEATAAWCLVRPPGHHAEADEVMGYCIFNNVAVAAAYAMAAYPAQIERVLIVDWDVHHGNGTQHIFEHDPRVLFFDLHQDKHYPEMGDLEERGLEQGYGTSWNIPLKAGSTGADYFAVLDELLPALFERHQPQLLLVSTGFDPHDYDALGDMRLTQDDFAQLALRLQRLADQHTGGKMVMMLEGGYDLRGLSRSVAACVEALRQPEAEIVASKHRAKPQTHRVIEAHQRWLEQHPNK